MLDLPAVITSPATDGGGIIATAMPIIENPDGTLWIDVDEIRSAGGDPGGPHPAACDADDDRSPARPRDRGGAEADTRAGAAALRQSPAPGRQPTPPGLLGQASVTFQFKDVIMFARDGRLTSGWTAPQAPADHGLVTPPSYVLDLSCGPARGP